MLAAFKKTLVEHRLVEPGDRVLIALSGGADSVALLHLFQELTASFSLVLHAAHLDHGIRRESGRDLDFVSRLCAELAIPLVSERIDVPALAEVCGKGLEETAREARRDFLQRIAAAHRCRVVALGHHRGDQAETFLHRLLRGSAMSGLAAMRLQRGSFIRPLLPFSRDQILSYLKEKGAAYVEDASNRDPAFTRNRIRHELLPRLGGFNPRIEEHLARLAGRIALEEDFWRIEEERSLEVLATVGEGEVRLERAKLATLHPALRDRVLRRALEKVRGDLRGIGAAHLEAIGVMALGRRAQAQLDLPGGWAACRYEWLWLRRRPFPPAQPYALDLPGPGVYPLPDGRRLSLEIIDAPRGEEAFCVEFDAAGVSFPLVVRTFRPGDRFRPAGMEGRKKLKAFFIDERIDHESRQRLPLVEADEILWVAGVRRCAGRRPVHPSGKVLRMALSRPREADYPLVKS